MKLDPYNHKQKYLNWKEKTKEAIPNVSKYNSDIIKQYLSDMEKGLKFFSKFMSSSVI